NPGDRPRRSESEGREWYSMMSAQPGDSSLIKIASSVRAPASAPVALSLVVPIHNESAGLDDFFSRVLPVLHRIGGDFEIVCVDDGSTDDSIDRLLHLRERLPNL